MVAEPEKNTETHSLGGAPYKTREGGATVTVFVPYNCSNNCPFCINKAEYDNPVGFSAEKICDSVRRMDRITPCCDFVFTGGEPFADLEVLQQMLDAFRVRTRCTSIRPCPYRSSRRKTMLFLLQNAINTRLRASTYRAICSIMSSNRMMTS